MVDINYYDVNGRPQNTGLMQSVLAVYGDGENPPEVQRKIQEVLRGMGYNPNGADWDRWDVPKIAAAVQAAVPEYKMPSQTFNIVKNLPASMTAPTAAPAAITGAQILGAANDPAKLQALGNPGAEYTQAENQKLSAILSPAPQTPAPATPPGAVAAPATAGATAGGTGGWNQDYATEWGRLFGFLGENEIATGGLLNQRVAAAGKQDMYQKAMADANAGKPIDIEAAIDAEIERQKKDPSYGKLLQSYKDPKPFSMADYQADPGYQFRLQEGQKALDRKASANGMMFSGAALKGAADYAGKLASDEYGNAYNRYNNDYNIGYQKYENDQNSLYSRLTGVANTGAGFANTAVNNNQNNANALGSIYGQLGNAQAGAALSNGSNFGNTLSGLLGASNNIGKSTYAPTNYGTYSTQGALPWQKPGATYPIY